MRKRTQREREKEGYASYYIRLYIPFYLILKKFLPYTEKDIFEIKKC